MFDQVVRGALFDHGEELAFDRGGEPEQARQAADENSHPPWRS